MSPTEIQSTIDMLFGRAQNAMKNGERDYARGLLDGMRELQRMIPEPVAAPPPPPPAPVIPPPEIVELPEGV